MKDDVRKYIYVTILAFLVVVGGWVIFLFLNACDFTFTCKRGALLIERTPVPSLIPATMPAATQPSDLGQAPASEHCRVRAVDFVGAWVNAGALEEEPFQFTDINGQTCSASYVEINQLFTQSNYWYSGSLACSSCHSADVAVSPAQLDLSSYAGVLAGSRRESADVKGTDILGKGNWANSVLYKYVSANQADIPGHNNLITDALIYIGNPLATPAPTSAPTATEIVPTPTP